jgi:hypothetical protein
LLPEYAEAAEKYSKRFLLEEFGFSGKNETLQTQQYTDAISKAINYGGTPWMFWMLGQGGGQDSLNLFPGDKAFDEAVGPLAIKSGETGSAQSWPDIDEMALS